MGTAILILLFTAGLLIWAVSHGYFKDDDDDRKGW